MSKERLKPAPITWQLGDRRVSLYAACQVTGEDGLAVHMARATSIQFGKTCLRKALTRWEPEVIHKLTRDLRDYSQGRRLNKRQDITLRWILKELERR